MDDKKKAIFNSAKNLFSKKGFKDTNISDIAKDAGIAVGTYYNYYSSKEELFLKIFIDENMKLKKSMFKKIKPDDDPVTVSTRMMTQGINATNSNRILKEWYNKELFSKLERYFYQQNGMQSIAEFMQNDIAELIKQWKNTGKIRNDIDDGMILAILSSVVYIDMHKTEIGIQYFPKIVNLLYEFIMKGLTNR
jgi:AcrR family transcriptional regulator